MALAIQQNILLNQYTTLHVGGVADYFAEINNVAEVREGLLFVEQTKAPLLILGGGSNLLIPDAGYRGLVLRMGIKGREYSEVDEVTCLLKVGAGEVFDEVVADSVGRGLWGLENLSAIPGSVGATPVQNVGAYGVEVASLITQIEAINLKTKEEKVFSSDECLFSYRNSFFKTAAGKQWIITAVTFKLSKTPTPILQYADLALLQSAENIVPQTIRKSVIAIRSKKFPDWNVLGTAGSFFKNPIIPAAQFAELQQKYPAIPGHTQAGGMIKVSLGYILDKICNLRGYREGSVCLYENQALVLVHDGSATAAEIKNFSQNIIEKVFLITNLKIESEVVQV